jgi:RimJ/RimL family protein N-acetyltransferase
VKSIIEMESDVALKDGSSIHIRPIRREDDRLLIQMFNNSSPQTIYQRFLAPVTELTPAMARYLSSVDHRSRVALIAEADTEPIGVARYEPTNEPDSVELGLIVVDDWQNRGLGRILLREIFRAAEANGIHRFCAHVLGENHRILRLLATEGQIHDSKIEAGMITLSFTSRSSF